MPYECRTNAVRMPYECRTNVILNLFQDLTASLYLSFSASLDWFFSADRS